MAVTVRMHKVGKGTKKKFYFRIGVVDRSKSRDGKVIEDIGIYEPGKKENNFKINHERLNYWKSKGAIISPTVNSLARASAKAKS